MRKADLLPLPYPAMPKLSPVLSEDQLEEYFSEFETVRAENNRRFNLAMRRISLCAHLHGFLEVPGASLEQKIADPKYHFKWCPQPEWWAHTGSSLLV